MWHGGTRRKGVVALKEGVDPVENVDVFEGMIGE